MSAIPGTIGVNAPIAPTDTTDTFPSHLARYGKGSLRTVPDHTARDAIPAEQREPGMLVFTENDDTYWQLGEDLSNASWTAFGGNTAAIIAPELIVRPAYVPVFETDPRTVTEDLTSRSIAQFAADLGVLNVDNVAALTANTLKVPDGTQAFTKWTVDSSDSISRHYHHVASDLTTAPDGIFVVVDTLNQRWFIINRSETLFESSSVNIRALTEATLAIHGQILVTGCYQTPGDGGGNIFYYDSSDNSTPDDGGTTFVETRPSGRRWKTIARQLNLFQWGCKTQVGFDNTARIQAALDSGRTVVIPETGLAAFNFTSTVHLRTSGQAIIGIGNRSRLTFTNSSQPAIDNDTGATINYLTLRDFYLECFSNAPVGLHLKQIANSSISGLQIWNAITPLLVDGQATGSHRNEIRSCHFFGLADGTAIKLTGNAGSIGAASTRITGCYCKTHGTAGRGIDCDKGSNILILSCLFDAGGGAAADCCVRCNDLNIIIEGSRFEPATGTQCAIKIESTATGVLILKNHYAAAATWAVGQISDGAPYGTFILDSYFSESGPFRNMSEREFSWGRGGSSFRPARGFTVVHQTALETAGIAGRVQSSNSPSFVLATDDADQTVKLNVSYSSSAPLIGFYRANNPEQIFQLNGAKNGHYLKMATSAPTTTDIPQGWFGFYMKGNRFCITFNDGGTLKHASILMDATTTTWTNTQA